MALSISEKDATYTGFYIIKIKINPLRSAHVLISEKPPAYMVIKGQLISKCLLGVIVSTKIPTKKFDNFCPRNLKRGEIIR